MKRMEPVTKIMNSREEGSCTCCSVWQKVREKEGKHIFLFYVS